MESLTPFIRHELEDAPGPSGPPEETSSLVSPPLGVEPGQPPVTEPPKPGCGSQQPPSQPDGPDVQLPPPEVPQPRPDCSIQHPGQVVLHTTSQSASQTAPLVGEPLAKPFTLRGLPKPPLPGEVARRRRDGEVVRRKACPRTRPMTERFTPKRYSLYTDTSLVYPESMIK